MQTPPRKIARKWPWVLIVGTIALVASTLLLATRSPHHVREPHRSFTIKGFIELRQPGPEGAKPPAAVCMSANGFRMIMGEPVSASPDDNGKGFVVCRIPPEGLRIPFIEVQPHTTESYVRTILLAAFLVSTKDRPAACEDAGASLVEVSLSEIGELCSTEKPPPKSELALLAPYHDAEGMPADTIKVVATHVDQLPGTATQ